jgi:hypothetical protein
MGEVGNLEIGHVRTSPSHDGLTTPIYLTLIVSGGVDNRLIRRQARIVFPSGCAA